MHVTTHRQGPLRQRTPSLSAALPAPPPAASPGWLARVGTRAKERLASLRVTLAFVGDVLFAGSVGRTDFPGGDFDTLVSSITQRLWPMGDDTVFIPGHGPESTIGRERRSNPFVGGT